MSKAFDKVPHCPLLCSLANAGVTGPLLNWFKSYLSDRSHRVVLDGFSSNIYPVTSGVPQGSILGPLLFPLYVNDLTKVPLSQDSTLILYADDIVLYKRITSSSDVSTLQTDVNKVNKWINDAGLSLNASKSKVVVFSRKHIRPVISLSVGSSVIPVVDSTCYLGVTLSNDLKWNAHISRTCAKARQQLGVIHRNFNQADSTTLLHLYRTLVLPTLDYCSSVWDPQSSSPSITKQWSFRVRHSNHPVHTLNLCPLQERRLRQKVLVWARILKGHSIIPSTYYTPLPNPRLRLHHPCPLITPFTRTAAHQSSFFVHSTRLRNSLPCHVVSASSSYSFKNRIKDISLISVI